MGELLQITDGQEDKWWNEYRIGHVGDNSGRYIQALVFPDM